MKASPVVIQAVNNAYRNFKEALVSDPGNAPFVSGQLRKDLFMHWLTTECGIRIPEQATTNYVVVDEEKYSMFILKWS